MTVGQHGASLSSVLRVMTLTNGPPGLLRLQRAVTRRPLHYMYKMDRCKHPPNWRLWHPNQRLVFQQPLYPTLDAARFFSEASVAGETITSSSGDEDGLCHNTLKRVRGLGVRRDTRNIAQETHEDGVVKEQSTIERTRTILKTTTIVKAETSSEGAATVQEKAEDKMTVTVQEEEEGTSLLAETNQVAGEEVPTNPPFTPLDYKIPDEAFYAAKAAAEKSPESFWSYSLYRGPSGEGNSKKTDTKVTVHYCKSAHTAERVCQYFLKEKILGLDLEWSPEATKYSPVRRNVSLVQLASESRVALLHLAMFPYKDELVAPTLKRILEDPEITKCGVWIRGDCTRLRKFLDVNARGIFELSHLFNQVKYSSSGQPKLINKRLVSLANQIKETMGLPMFKGQDVRASDWSQPLGMSQISYSASDAYAAVQLFAILNHKRQNLVPTPPLPFHAELDRPIPIAADVETSSSDEAEGAEGFEVEGEAELGVSTHLSSKYLGMAEGDEELAEHKPGPDVSLPQKKAVPAAAAKPALQPKDPRIEAADIWLMLYKAARPIRKSNAAGASLRAYFLWHVDEQLKPEDIAQLLREPPLKTTTVIQYILDAVKHDKLPFDRQRLKEELLGRLSEDIIQIRYAAFVKEMMSTAGEPKSSSETKT